MPCRNDKNLLSTTKVCIVYPLFIGERIVIYKACNLFQFGCDKDCINDSSIKINQKTPDQLYSHICFGLFHVCIKLDHLTHVITSSRREWLESWLSPKMLGRFMWGFPFDDRRNRWQFIGARRHCVSLRGITLSSNYNFEMEMLCTSRIELLQSTTRHRGSWYLHFGYA